MLRTLAVADVPFLSSALDDLGVTLHAHGGTLRVWSSQATSIELVLFDAVDLDWITDTLALTRGADSVWQVTTPALVPGARYAIRVDGPHGPGDTFNPQTLLLDPYAKGLV